MHVGQGEISGFTGGNPDEADSVMQPFSSPDDATSHRADAAFEYSNLPPDLSANERFCHMLLRNPPCFFRLPCLMTDDSSAEDIVFSLLRALQKQEGAAFELQKGARGRGGGGGEGWGGEQRRGRRLMRHTYP